MLDTIIKTINQDLAASLSGKNVHPAYSREGHVVGRVLISDLVTSLIHEKAMIEILFSNYRIVSGEYNLLV